MKLKCEQCLLVMLDVETAINHVESTGHLVTGTTADGDDVRIELTYD